MGFFIIIIYLYIYFQDKTHLKYSQVNKAITSEKANSMNHNSRVKLMRSQESEAVVQRCSVKKALMKISQNSQENNCATVSFCLRPATLLKRLWRRCFPVNCAKFLRTRFFIEHYWWLLLKNVKQIQNFLK